MEIKSSELLIYTDELSGLFNRRYLYYYLPQELQAAKEEKYSLWLFMLDVDNFKIINDTYGHLFGDEILKGLSTILTENTKSDDKKIRYAGDEFTLIMARLSREDVLNVADRLLAKINAYAFKEKRSGKEVRITISIGIAGFPQDTADYMELINLADRSLYISKQKGKNCISTASEITPELFWKKDILERFPCSVLVERDSQLSQLQEATSQFFLISGELGIGKSRLLNEFERRLSSFGKATCLSVRCEEKLLNQPYYIAGEILYKYLISVRELPQQALEGIPQDQLQTLVNFMPILKEMTGLTPAPDSVLGEDVLGEAWVKFFLNISKLKACCLLFDDFHYVDSQTLKVILRLAQENKKPPILIAVNVSSEMLAVAETEGLPLAGAMKTETFQKSAETINLPRLSSSGTREMVASIFFKIPLSNNFFDLVYKVSAGNPLFVEELLKYIIEKEFISYGRGKWIEQRIEESQLPLSIAEAIKARIDDLSVETKEMIAKAAVIGEDFGVDLLQKIDSEDRGYILDLMEAAKKIGLIYEKSTGGKDEFSFVTDEIRKVLFKTIGEPRTKHLYSRLGEIKEKLNPDKISSIAGELYFNFKKAEDWMRAEQYAKVVKEGRSSFYDRTMKYAQALLEEVAETKIAQPLSKEALSLVPDIIRFIYIASINYILYPPGNAMRVQAIEEVYQRLSQVLDQAELLNISCVDKTIIVNNKRMGKDAKAFFQDSFTSFLKNLNIESISFAKGLDKQEVTAFIETINSAKEKEEGLSEALKRAGVRYIQINEISYDISQKKSKEKENLEEIMLIDYLLGKMPTANGEKVDLSSAISTHAEEVAGALEQLGEQVSKQSGKDKETVKAEIMARSIQNIGGQLLEKGKEDWAKYKEGLAKTILAMEPSLRSNIFAVSPDDKTRPDIIKELSMDIPDDIIVDVLSKQYAQKGVDLEKMSKLVQKFLSSPGKKEKLTPLLKDKFKQMGASNEECALIFDEESWEKISGQDKLDKILNLGSKELLKILPMMKIGPLVRELLSGGQYTQTEAVFERLLKLLEEGYLQSPHLVNVLKEILDILIQSSADRLLPKFIERLLKITAFNPAGLAPIFSSILSPYLERLIQIFLAAGKFTLIKEIARIYTHDPKIILEASGIFASVADKLIEELIRRIDVNLDWTDLVEILILLKDQAVESLVDAALFERGVPEGGYFEAYLRRRTIAKILEQVPKENLLGLLKEKFSDKRGYIIKNLIELIGSMEDGQILKILEIPLKHAEVIIRRKTIFVLSKRKEKESTLILAQALKDEDEILRKYALRILKNRTDNFAQEVLKACIEDKDIPEDIRQAL